MLVTDGHSLRKYYPNPDFTLLPSRHVDHDDPDMPRGFCPILLGEIVSDADEIDRWRMLLQLALCARFNNIVTKAVSTPIVVQGVYLSGKFCAERYLAYADKTEQVEGHDLTAIMLYLIDSLIESASNRVCYS